MTDPAVSTPLLDELLATGSEGLLAIAEQVRGRIGRIARQPLAPSEKLARVRRLLARYEPLLSRVTSDALLASWVAGASSVAPETESESSALPPAEPPPRRPIASAGAEGEPPPVVRFPTLEAAARDLLERRIVTRPEFDAMAREARRAAFTVARTASLETIEVVHDAVVDALQQGHTREEFAGAVEQALGGTMFSERHLENVFRTNIMSAHTAGLMDTLADPLVGDEFPFVETVPITDGRLSELCRVASESGLDGTGVFVRDDPEWARLVPPRHYNCRCGIVPLSVEDAAAKGVRYAREWLELGHRPAGRGHVPRVPVETPKGWTGGRLEAIL